MTKEDWESLTSCPGWSALRQYLRDYRTATMNQWANGSFDSDSPAGIRAQMLCSTLSDLAGMDWDSIDNFYRPPQQEETDEA